MMVPVTTGPGHKSMVMMESSPPDLLSAHICVQTACRQQQTSSRTKQHVHPDSLGHTRTNHRRNLRHATHTNMVTRIASESGAITHADTDQCRCLNYWQ
uniref:Uncharacterized protein n=1 Tax=Setaria italica TaxID=4555 RepID=K3YB47_SETIT